MLERHLIKHLAPAWFAVIMGTGGLANILFQWQNSFPAGNLLGTLFAILADLLYFVVLVPWVIRWICFFDYAYRDLNHLHTGNFFVTMPVATTILGTNIYLIWSHYLSQATVYHVILGLWIISIIGVCFLPFIQRF